MLEIKMVVFNVVLWSDVHRRYVWEIIWYCYKIDTHVYKMYINRVLDSQSTTKKMRRYSIYLFL